MCARNHWSVVDDDDDDGCGNNDDDDDDNGDGYGKVDLTILVSRIVNEKWMQKKKVFLSNYELPFFFLTLFSLSLSQTHIDPKRLLLLLWAI